MNACLPAVLLAPIALLALPAAADAPRPSPAGQETPAAAADPGYRRTLLGRPYWCRGDNCLAHGRRYMPGADRASFRPLAGGYAIDRQRVWFEGREVHGAAPDGWQVLGPAFARDRRQVFLGVHAVPGPDPAHARHLPRHHVADRRQAWYGEFQGERLFLRRLEGADGSRLRLLDGYSDTLATDGASLFLAGERLAIELADDFQPLWAGHGIGLAFRSAGRLHLLAPARPPVADSLAARVPAQRRGQLLSLAVHWQGDGAWGLADGHLLVAAHEGDLHVLREGVATLQRLPGTAFHAIVDGRVLFRHPNRAPALVDLGPAADDLAVLDAWRLRHDGRIWFAGEPLP